MDLNPVIAALEQALVSTPNNPALQLHLARTYLEAGRPTDGLAQYSALLAIDPVNPEALRGAAQAALACNQPTLAQAYNQILAALNLPVEEIGTKPIPSERPSPPPTDPAPAASTEGATRRQVGRFQVIDGGATDDPTEPGRGFIRPSVTLDDVAGLEEVKRRLDMAFLGPIRNPALSRTYGKGAAGGLLLYGPPGCGKTYIAKALAGELGFSFVSVGLHDVMDMWLGESEKRLHGLFEYARSTAPAMLFFDELDAIGHKRSNLGGSASRNIVNQLLVELDGVDGKRDSVFVLAATNLPWDVDTALRRPGRFDRTLFIPPPDDPARRQIMEFHLQDRPTQKLDLDSIVKKSRGFSGADLRLICELATEYAMERALRSGTTEPVTQRDLSKALGETKATTKTWFEAANNYVMFANSSGEYNEVAEFLRRHRF